MTKPLDLERFPVHLGLGARAVSEPELTGMDWFGPYAERHAGDGDEGRLVSMYTFRESWKTWEAHPLGDEVVVCTAGEITLLQELPDGVRKVTLHPGEYAINPRGVWHTADIADHATALFITAGRGTDHRPR
jgi:homogentisate 1,2-dioxygenase